MIARDKLMIVRIVAGNALLALLLVCLPQPAAAGMPQGARIRVAAADLSTLSDEEILNKAPHLTLRQLTDLLDVYERMGKKEMSAAMAQQIVTRDPDNEAALKVLGRLKKPDSDDPDVDNETDAGDDRTQAEIDTLMGEHRFDEVISRLKDMKARQYAGARFPYQYDLADALYRRGEVVEARRAFGEILTDAGYEQDERDDASLQHRELSGMLGGGVRAGGAWFNDEEGTAYRGFLTMTSPLLTGDWRFGVRARRDHITIHCDEKEIKHPDTTLYETEGFVDMFFQGGIAAGLSVGDSTHDTLAGAYVEKTFGTGITLGAAVAFNQHTDDSLQLETLNGRQDYVNVLLRAPLLSRLQLDIDLFVRSVGVSSDRIGSGYGGEVDLGYTVCEAQRRRPSLTVLYVGDVNISDHRRFSSSRFAHIADDDVTQHELLHDLIERRINRHGPGIALEGTLGTRVAYEVSGAALYDFTDEEWQYISEMRLNVPLTCSMSLYLGGSYESEGRAGSNNSDVYGAETGLEFFF